MSNLNLRITDARRNLAMANYPNYGDSESAIKVVKAAVSSIKRNNYAVDVPSAIKILESTGARLSQGEKAFAEKKYPGIVCKESQNNSNGEIAVSLRKQHEFNEDDDAYYVLIDMDTNMMSWGLIKYYDANEFEKLRDDYVDEDYRRFTEDGYEYEGIADAGIVVDKIDFNLEEMSIDRINEMEQLVREWMKNQGNYAIYNEEFYRENGVLWQLL